MDKLQELLKELEISEETVKNVEKIVNEAVELKILESKENLEKEYQEEFEDKFKKFTDEIVEKLSLYLDDVIEENLTIPEEVEEWAKTGKTYHKIVETFKTMISLDEGLVNEETQKALSETTEKTKELEEKLDTVLSENLELHGKLKKLEVSMKINELSDAEGLSDEEKETVVKLLDDIDDVNEVESKFETVVKYIKGKKQEKEATEEDTVEGKGEAIVEEVQEEKELSEDMKKFRKILFGG